jgi:hypothetical protein
MAALAAAAALAVVVLPLHPDDTISGKQAAGVTFQVRDAIDRGGFAKLLAASPADAKQADKCGVEIACLTDLAKLRGADVLLAGSVAPTADGLTLKIVAVGPGVAEGTRAFTRKIHGDDEDQRALDRLVRELVDPRQLLGAIYV